MSEYHSTDPEYFDWQGIIIRQKNTVHKVGTDAVLLGSWIPKIIPQATSILDAGTGTGVLALMMARCYPRTQVLAIDSDEESIQLAKVNVLSASQEDRVEVCAEDILEKSTSDPRYDLVLCNPPYHEEKIFPKEEFKQRAKHINAPVKEWVTGLTRRMTEDGHLILVVPSGSAKVWIEAANDIGYFNHDRLDVFSFEDDAHPKRTLLHLTRKLAKPSNRRLVIYHKDKTYTSGYLQFTGISPTLHEKK